MNKRDMIELAKRRAAYRKSAEYQQQQHKARAIFEDMMQREVDDITSPIR